MSDPTHPPTPDPDHDGETVRIPQPEENFEGPTKKMSESERDELLESLGEETDRIKATQKFDMNAEETSMHPAGQTAASPGGAPFEGPFAGEKFPDPEADTAAMKRPPLGQSSPAARQKGDVRLESSRPELYSPTAKVDRPPTGARGAQAATPPPLTPTLPPLTEAEFEDDRPYDLRPEEAKPEPEPVPGAKTTEKAGWIKPIAVGAMLGLVLGAALYFAPWPAQFPMPTATLSTQALPELDGQQPPTQWIAAGGVFIGIDATQRPWVYRPGTGEALRARRQGPPAGALATVTVDGFPALEPVCRLVWIETAAGTSPTSSTAARLQLGSFGFGGAEPEGLPLGIELPEGLYRQPPQIKPDPSNEQGILIGVVAGNGDRKVFAASRDAIATTNAAWEPEESHTAARGIEALEALSAERVGELEIDLNGDGRNDTLALLAEGNLWVMEGGRATLAALAIIPEAGAIKPVVQWNLDGKTLSLHGFTSENLAFTMDIPVPVEYSAREAAQLLRDRR